MAVSFVDATHGFGVYAPQTATNTLPLQVVETSNSGSTWEIVGPSPVGGTDPTTFPSMLFIDNEDGLVYNSSGLFATHDGGKTWSTVSLPGQVLRVSTSQGSGRQEIWVTYTTCPVSPSASPCGAGVDVSANTGRTWKPLVLPTSPYRQAQVVIGSRGALFLGLWSSAGAESDPGELLVSNDQGTTWTTHVLPCPVGYRLGGQLSVAPDDTLDTVWMVCTGQGSGGMEGVVIYRSEDDGQTWTAESSYELGGPTGVRGGAPGGRIEDLVALASTEALALQVNGGLVLSNDGGATWKMAGTSAMSQGFLGTLDMLDASDGWVAFWITVPGYKGLWHTTDGATTWQEVS